MLNIFKNSKKRKYENIKHIILKKYNEYNQLYIHSCLQNEESKYYFAMITAYQDIYTILINNKV